MAQNKSTTRLIKFAFLVMLVIVALLFNDPIRFVAADISDSFAIYLPILFDYTPPVTTSLYMGYNNGNVHNLDWNKVEQLGCNQGNLVQPETDTSVILNFGQPWADEIGYGVRLFDSPQYTFVYTSTVSYLSMAYANGFWECSPSNAHLSLAIGLNNYGAYMGSTSGREWGETVNDVYDYLSIMHYTSKVDVFGAIDNELDWNPPSKSHNWAASYGRATIQDYLYFGDCAGCPTEANPSVAPNNGWSLSDLFQIVDGRVRAGGAIPQIYLVTGENADQWKYLSLYTFINYNYPLTIHGSLTEWNACLERNECFSGTSSAIDNYPTNGWTQL